MNQEHCMPGLAVKKDQTHDLKEMVAEASGLPEPGEEEEDSRKREK